MVAPDPRALADAPRCLDEQVVLDLIAGDLVGPSLALVERHLASCDACIEVIVRMAPALSRQTSPPTQPAKPEGKVPAAEAANRVDAEIAAFSDADDDDAAEPEPDRQQSQPGPLPSLRPGAILRDTYRIVRPIDKGGMGEVYEASHARLSGRYAVKVLPPEFAANKTMLLRFRREAQIASGLQHPNIVQVIDFHQMEDGRPYLVMEYLDGENLANLMARHGPFTLVEALPIIAQVAAALGAVHRKGVVHRDIKPPNVFIIPQLDGTRLVKLLDFGISKGNALSSVVTRQQAMMGTPQYMAPEQALRRTEDVGPATDQFALAAIVYEMLTGHPAFEGPLVSVVLYQIVHEPPPAMGGDGAFDQIETVLHRALAKKASERFSSMADFMSALTAAASPPGPRAVARPRATEDHASLAPARAMTPIPTRRRLRTAIAALIAAGIAAVVTLLMIRWINPLTDGVSGSSAPRSVGGVPGARPAPPHAIRPASVDDGVPARSGGGARVSSPGAPDPVETAASAAPSHQQRTTVPGATRGRRLTPSKQPSHVEKEPAETPRPPVLQPVPVAPPALPPQGPSPPPSSRLVEEL